MEELNYHVDFGPFYVHLTQKQKRYLAVRSIIDRILAALALVLLSPLFLAVSIAQKFSAPDEPIFFLQKRVGKGAHCFNIIKFRTMKSSAPKNVATGDLENPQMYISKVGRFLRDTSIDELPQLANVVRGEMSLIGPRPLVYNKFYEQLREKTGFEKDKRIKFVGTVYDQDLLKKIREEAYGYLHGHEVGGTNPSLLEALASTRLNLLLGVGFNKEVGEDSALYWNKEPGSLATLLEKADTLDVDTIEQLDKKSTARVQDAYSWGKIVNEYENVFLRK